MGERSGGQSRPLYAREPLEPTRTQFSFDGIILGSAHHFGAGFSMADDKITVDFACKNSGTKLEWPNNAIDSTRINCGKCGENFGTYRDLRDAAMKAARDEVAKSDASIVSRSNNRRSGIGILQLSGTHP
jgi:hypothetical protein